MARFAPFPALRYDLTRIDPAAVLAPPYDVVDDQQRARLAARDPHNAVLVDLPTGGDERYDVARCLLADWRDEGVLVLDPSPTFTIYRMSSVDDAGRHRHTTGVLGALELTAPGTDILPHEHTTPKARSDRLDLMRACRANLSAIWGLSLAKGLTDLLPTGGDPAWQVTDDDGVVHTVWRTDDPDVGGAIAGAVGDAPVLIADGHHRYETSLTYRAEREAADGDAGPAAATLAYVVELVEDELTVHAIHRLLSGLPAEVDLAAALAPWFDDLGPPDPRRSVLAEMDERACLTLVLTDREVLLRPRADALAEARDLDSSRLDVARAGLPAHDVRYQHGVEHVRAAVSRGEAQAGVLLRPATVAQIEATAHGGDRMPPKTTFFHPKPKTGVVFRLL